MRQKRLGRSRSSSGKMNNVIIFFVLAPIVAILITVGLFKYLILPYISSDDNPSNVSEEIPSDDNNPQGNNITDKDNPDITDSYITLELEGLTLFNVQLGSFSSKENAQTLVDKLLENGINGYLVDSNGYKVYAGRFFSRGEAEKYRDELKDTYSDAFIKEFYIGGASIEYLASDQEFEDDMEGLVSTFGDSFSEESSLWTLAISNNNINDLKEKTINNNNIIDGKLALIKGKVKSASMQGLIESLENQYQERKEMVNSLAGNNPESILKSYQEFNNILVKYMQTITQGQ